MDIKTANREWLDVNRDAPEGAPTEHTVHAFAQRVEALAIAGADKRYADARSAGWQLAKMSLKLAQRVGYPIDTHDVEVLDRLCRKWAESLAAA